MISTFNKEVPTMGCIYVITCCTTGKQYVGMTKHTANRRFTQHCYDSRNPKRSKRPKLHNHINKYGKDNFTVEVVHQHDNIETLIELEKQEIKARNSYHSGLNCTEGGDGWGIKEPWNKGKTHSNETKELLRVKRSQINHLVNSDEAKLKKSKSMSGKRYNKQTRDKSSTTWCVVDPFESLHIVNNLVDFCRVNSLCAPAMINTARGKLKQNRGYKCFILKPGPRTRSKLPFLPVPNQYLPALLDLFPDYDFSQIHERV